MSELATIALREIIAQRCGSVDPSKHLDEIFDLYSIPAFDRLEPEVLKGGVIGSTKQIVQPGDVLLSKIVPHIRRAWIVGKNRGRRIIASSEWIVFRSKQSDATYLRHVLVSDPFHAEFMRTVSGVGGSLLRARPEYVAKIKIPLPPIAEQKRIAAILDKAEELRGLRRKALEELDAIVQSIFLEMFGDPVTNPKEWKLMRFQDLLSVPLRNGLSPSNSGTVTGKVLTLSAITGNRFRESAIKTSTFQASPPSHQTVDDTDFLICRGNGNIHLVGKAYFPTYSMFDVVFPDTMIAAQIKSDYIEREFLQHIWNSNMVRSQIESFARTTNGTFKVNQTMLESILIPVPPLLIQQEFARRVEAIKHLKTAHCDSLTHLDALFASLQHRAFRGEL